MRLCVSFQTTNILSLKKNYRQILLYVTLYTVTCSYLEEMSLEFQGHYDYTTVRLKRYSVEVQWYKAIKYNASTKNNSSNTKIFNFPHIDAIRTCIELYFLCKLFENSFVQFKSAQLLFFHRQLCGRVNFVILCAILLSCIPTFMLYRAMCSYKL